MQTPTVPPREGRNKLQAVQEDVQVTTTTTTDGQFVPWFDRADLPPNRTSKKRTHKRKPQVINEILSSQTTPPTPANKTPTTGTDSENVDRYRTANDHVLNYLKEIQQRQQVQQQNQQKKTSHAHLPPYNVSVSTIKSKLLYQQRPSVTATPLYTLTPTVNDIITQWEQKKLRQEELTHEQRLQKERLLRLQQQQQPRRAYSLVNPRTSSNISQNNSTHHLYKIIPKLNLPPIMESNNANSNDMTDDGVLSPTSSTSSTCSSVDDERDHSLPSISKLHLPPLNLPPNGYDWDSHVTPRSASTPRNQFFEGMNMSPNLSPSSSSSPISSPRIHTTRSGRNTRYHSPRHAPYPSPRPLSNRQLSPNDVMSSLSGPDGIIRDQEQQHSQVSEQQLFEAVFKHTPCAMAIISVHGFFVSVNKSFSDLLGLSNEDELKNKNVTSVTCRSEESVFTNQFMHQLMVMLL